MILREEVMHYPIREQLEEYLRGEPNPEKLREFHAHMERCKSCRDQVQRMQTQTEMLRSLRSPEHVEPGAGFYARVIERIEAQRNASMWNAFLEPAFARRFVFAFAVLLILLGSYIVSTEPQNSLSASSPEVILAVEPYPNEVRGFDRQRDRQTVLVTLATYQE